MAWNEQTVADLTQMWKEGLSASVIAAKLGSGFTRNSVIGKIHRLKLSNIGGRKPQTRVERKPRQPRQPRLSGSKRAQATISSRQSQKVRDTFSLPPLEMAALPVEPAFTLPPTEKFGGEAILGLTESTCKWPIGDPRSHDFRFCTHEAHDGPYCAHHQARAYNGKQKFKAEQRMAS